MKAQRTRQEWQQKIKDNFEILKSKAEIEKVARIEEFEKIQVKEREDYKERVVQMRKTQTKLREEELEKLMLKYDKLKRDLANVHHSENKAIEKDLPVTLHEPTEQKGNEVKTYHNPTIIDKKKQLMQKINRLDRHRQVN